MQLKPYLETLYDYNFWANRRYFAVAEGLADEQLYHGHGHSWGDVYAMFTLMNVPHLEDEVIQYFLNLSGQKKFS